MPRWPFPPRERRAAVSAVAAADPRCLQAWATLAELADAPIDQYAFARVGYHRGLDSLRAAGWRGSGYVRWRHESNRGFLRSLHALETGGGGHRRRSKKSSAAPFSCASSTPNGTPGSRS